ncbi:tRNA pseudouridine(55) synthase TruB [Phormidium pseudopriestleyi FRX01]|uniref:tRNA pseudouridine synthase B n=1 Tax=Phormidium pseudopriestleyi FRX01 TaxID=1759528 RepID=A0ABS3FMR6_9CYAN|nr:tRNA pseudouridine(55) synthase TruB [Phormidium pseudopriestleyi FRX01]
MEGFLNLNKPPGMTSHDCVSRVRRLLRTKRVGHGGTLDPAATGVLPIAVGKATRLLQYLRQDKAYQATVRLGVTTTTDDLEGETIASAAVPQLTREQVAAQLPQFLGKISQIPPAYSAIQVQGKRLYDLARAGETVEVPSRIVEVHHIKVLDWREGDFPEIDLAIACGPGTYIRAIARDLGAVLGTGGTLAHLTRTESCGLYLKQSLTFEDIETQTTQGTFQLIPPDRVLAHLSQMLLNSTDGRRWCQGQRISLSELGEIVPPLRICGEDGTFLGISEIEASDGDWVLVPKMVFEPVS